MPAFQTALSPSLRLRCAVVLLHLAAAGVCILYFYGSMLWVGLIGLAGSFAHAWRVVGLRSRETVHKIVIAPQQRAVIFIGKESIAFEAVLLPSSVVTRYALFLHWDTGSRRIWQPVLADMAERDSYRRLRVWTRWCQGKQQAVRPSEPASS